MNSSPELKLVNVEHAWTLGGESQWLARISRGATASRIFLDDLQCDTVQTHLILYHLRRKTLIK